MIGMLRIDNDGQLLCPVCGFEYTHVSGAQVAARQREDGAINEITVDAGGRVQTHGVVPAAMGRLGAGRRQRIALTGDCENGHTFAIVFTQHKGVTIVETVAPVESIEVA